jgi:hypothetical protein
LTKSCICDERHYITLDNICKECLDHCIECEEGENEDEICLECESGYDLIEGKCEVSQHIIPKAMLKQAAQGTQGVMIASASVSFVSLNFNSILSMIGTIQILSYILLYNINIPDRVKDALEGISLFNIFPNIFEYFIPTQTTIEIERYQRVDIENELFLINSGKTLTTIITLLLAILILKMLGRLKSKSKAGMIIKKVVSKILGILEWNFIVGYLMQASLELTISSLTNIYYVSFSETHSIVGFTISVLIFVRNNIGIISTFSCLPATAST